MDTVFVSVALAAIMNRLQILENQANRVYANGMGKISEGEKFLICLPDDLQQIRADVSSICAELTAAALPSKSHNIETEIRGSFLRSCAIRTSADFRGSIQLEGLDHSGATFTVQVKSL